MSFAFARRIRATPYARRLARERNLPLVEVTGSGPNGRITADDLNNHPSAALAAAMAAAGIETPPMATQPAEAAAPMTAAAPTAPAPTAIVTRVEFAALDALLAQITTLRPGISREDICLKAAAVAHKATIVAGGDGSILLLASPDRRQHLAGLANASVSVIAALRETADSAGAASLAVSFIGRPGVRPVAAQLVDGVAARLVIGTPEEDGSADCLLSYDPARVGDNVAEDFLVTFRDLVATPFRLLV